MCDGKIPGCLCSDKMPDAIWVAKHQRLKKDGTTVEAQMFLASDKYEIPNPDASGFVTTTPYRKMTQKEISDWFVSATPSTKKTMTADGKDPWAGRATGMKCSTCMWFVEKDGGIVGTTVKGRCRRHAPTMNGYPVVFVTDWCGDHKLS